MQAFITSQSSHANQSLCKTTLNLFYRFNITLKTWRPDKLSILYGIEEDAVQCFGKLWKLHCRLLTSGDDVLVCICNKRYEKHQKRVFMETNFLETFVSYQWHFNLLCLLISNLRHFYTDRSTFITNQRKRNVKIPLFYENNRAAKPFLDKKCMGCQENLNKCLLKRQH